MGDAGNLPDKAYALNNPDGLGFGAVDYDFRIGTYEVTNEQYAEFLNAVAASDPYKLYHNQMGDNFRGGITRTGTNGNYVYAAKDAMGNKPVNYISYYDAVRFANWLHNGQGSGSTETGAYNLGQVNSNGEPLDPANVTRQPGAIWFLPSENEWYKAAYYQPASAGGDTDDYWLYSTRSNTIPTIAQAVNVAGPNLGDIANPGANVMNMNRGANWNTTVGGNVTTVGSAGPLSQSYYGTSDQGGNLWEWTEESIEGGTYHQARGGSFYDVTSNPNANGRYFYQSGLDSLTMGFRVATVTAVAPEPSSLALALVAAAGGLLAVRRRRRAR